MAPPCPVDQIEPRLRSPSAGRHATDIGGNEHSTWAQDMRAAGDHG